MKKRLKEVMQWQTTSCDKLTIGVISITPQSRALILRWPFGGWVWNRPWAIVVEQGGQTKRIPIVDVTRMVQIGLVGLGLLFSLVSFILGIQQRRKQNESPIESRG